MSVGPVSAELDGNFSCVRFEDECCALLGSFALRRLHDHWQHPGLGNDPVSRGVTDTSKH